MALPPFPIHDALPALRDALRQGTRAVLQAPPGAGKTTIVPLALLDEPWLNGRRILMLEPRRLAARASAERIAHLLGESIGQRVGYRMRGDHKTSAATRIEVITEGILTRHLQNNPEMPGVAAILFDEFHERSLHADLGLALSLEVQSALRDDLRLLVMSATLDGQAVSTLMKGAPIITSKGKSFPVETRWLATPPRKTQRFTVTITDLIEQAVAAEPGDTLVFLPGVGEIRQVEALLRERGLEETFSLHPLYGDLPPAAQQAALQRQTSDARRRIVLATSIAETSLTIEGIHLVVDGGKIRRAQFDPGAGMARLITETVSRAAADQRRGRAGRTAPGVCYRL